MTEKADAATTSSRREVLVAGIGNIFRTDDGFGPAVITRLLDRAPDGEPAASTPRIVDYGIRGMHLAYDLLDLPDVLILIDAVPDRGAPGRLSVLRILPEHLPAGAARHGQLDAHGMDPLTLLANLVSLGGQLPEQTLLVGCQAGDTGEGMGLSPEVEAAVAPAADVVRGLLDLRSAGADMNEVV